MRNSEKRNYGMLYYLMRATNFFIAFFRFGKKSSKRIIFCESLTSIFIFSLINYFIILIKTIQVISTFPVKLKDC